MGLLHAHAVTKAIQRANKLDVASEVRWARAIGLKKVCSLMRSKREPHYPRTCEQGSAEAMAVLHVMLSTLKRRHPTAQTRVSLCATCTGPCGTTDVADAGGATSLQDRGLPTSYKVNQSSIIHSHTRSERTQQVCTFSTTPRLPRGCPSYSYPSRSLLVLHAAERGVAPAPSVAVVHFSRRC